MKIISNNKQADTLVANRRTLNKTGLRATKQRALVLEIIRHGEGHLDADEVYRRARQKRPQLSLSTVYRALHLFKEKGLIEETHFDEAHHHYEAKPATEHHHLVCLKCGKVIEFRYLLSRYVKKNVPEARDFEIINTEVRMTGYCAQCQSKR